VQWFPVDFSHLPDRQSTELGDRDRDQDIAARLTREKDC
jgi:hypothetical protein